MPDPLAAELAMAHLDVCRAKEDSCGGVVECVIKGVPAGIGEPCFDKLSANLAKTIFSIGAVKGFELGDGFDVAKMHGSENNDPFGMEDGHVKKLSNHSGGTLGASATEVISSSGPLSSQPRPSAGSSTRSTNPAKRSLSPSRAATTRLSYRERWSSSSVWQPLPCWIL